MRNWTTELCAAAGLGLLAFSATAPAAPLSCVTGNNTVTVDSSKACSPTPGQNDQQVDETALLFNPGNLGPYEWTYLDKDNRLVDAILDNEANQIAGADEDWFNGFFTDGPGANRMGEFTLDVSSYLGLGFSQFMIYLKPGNDGVYFLLDGAPVNGLLSGTFNISGLAGCTRGNCNGNGLSHMTLYGIEDASDRELVPEPGSLALLGLGLAGLGMARRRRAS